MRPVKYLYVYNDLLQSINSGVYPEGSKLPSEYDLTISTGLSRQTVRNALKKLQEDGYVSSSQGSGYYVTGSKRSSSKRICHISIRITDYIFPKLLNGIEEVVTASGYTLALMSTGNSVWQEHQILTRLNAENIDGLIVSGTKSGLPNPNISIYRDFARRGLPIVFVNSYYPELVEDNCIFVVMEDQNGGYQLGKYLSGRDIHHVGGFIRMDDIQGIRRYTGFIQACMEFNIPFYESDFFTFSSEQMIDQLDFSHISNKLDSFDAIFCYNDEVLYHLSRYMDSHPLPHLKYVCSFDRMFDVKCGNAKILSLRHVGPVMGRIASQKLFNMLSGKKETSVAIPWELPPEML